MRFNHKIWANGEIRTFALPKNGGTYPLVRPQLLKGGGPRAPNFSYASDLRLPWEK